MKYQSKKTLTHKNLNIWLCMSEIQFGINLHYQQLRGSSESIMLLLHNCVIISVASQNCHSLSFFFARELINSDTMFNNWIQDLWDDLLVKKKSFVCNNWRELEFHSLCASTKTMKLSSFHLFSFYISLFHKIINWTVLQFYLIILN